jgi:short-subunit dehydrogenase
VRRFGIDVVLIEPGVVRTPWSERALQHQAAVGGAVPAGDAGDPYAEYKQAVTGSFERAYRGPLARLSLSPEAVARVIGRAVETPRPRTRYLVSPLARTLVTAKRVLPDRAYDRLLKQQYRLP